MVKLGEVAAPFLVSVLCEATAQTQFEAYRRSSNEGAGVAEVNLAQLPAAEADALAACDWTGLPSYVACRRREFMQVYGYASQDLDALSDDERIERQFGQLGWAAGLDIELDLFQSGGPAALAGLPCQVVGDAESARRRNSLIDAVHLQGKLAILSCHTGFAPDALTTATLASYMAGCGADACKIVHTHTEPSFMAELTESVRRLRQLLEIPFVLLSIGPGSLLHRHTACQSGCSYCFGRPSGVSHFFPGHPPLETLEQVSALLPPQTFWRDMKQ